MNGTTVKQAPKPADSSWAPVLWSTVVYPGIGQWMQKRRNAGSFYFTTFTVLAILFTWLLIAYLIHVIPIVRDALEGLPLEGHELPPLKAILQPFGAVLFLYFANIVDVLRGRKQLLRKAASTIPP